MLIFAVMIKIIAWLGKNKLMAVLLGIIVYFSIVTFHDEVTGVAIRIRNAIGRDRYNEILGYSFLVLLILVCITYFRYSLKGNRKILKTAMSLITAALMVISFRLLMVYNIEAIHFVEYMILAIILLPVFGRYGETVFWVSLLGILDELFQYHFLTPNFEYFDFNDSILNLLGAGAGAVMIFNSAGDAFYIKQVKWYRSPAFITAASLLVIFPALFLTGKMVVNPAEISINQAWFSINRTDMPDEFWTTGYPGRVFHILKPLEGLLVMILLFAGFSMLDLFARKNQDI